MAAAMRRSTCTSAASRRVVPATLALLSRPASVVAASLLNVPAAFPQTDPYRSTSAAAGDGSMSRPSPSASAPSLARSLLTGAPAPQGIQQRGQSLRRLSVDCTSLIDCVSCSSAYPQCAWCASSGACVQTPAALSSVVANFSDVSHVVYSLTEYSLSYWDQPDESQVSQLMQDDSCGVWMYNAESCGLVEKYCWPYDDVCHSCTTKPGCGYYLGSDGEHACVAGTASGAILMDTHHPIDGGGKWSFGEWNLYYSTEQWTDKCVNECPQNLAYDVATGFFSLGDPSRQVSYPANASCQWHVHPAGFMDALEMTIRFMAYAAPGDVINVHDQNGHRGYIGCPQGTHNSQCVYMKQLLVDPPVTITFDSVARFGLALGAFSVSWDVDSDAAGHNNNADTTVEIYEAKARSQDSGGLLLIVFLSVVLCTTFAFLVLYCLSAWRRVDEAADKPTEVDIEILESQVPSCRPYRVARAGVGADAESCSVCLNELEAGDEARDLPCGHTFHRPCIDEWLHRSIICPMCRAPVAPASYKHSKRRFVSRILRFPWTQCQIRRAAAPSDARQEDADAPQDDAEVLPLPSGTIPAPTRLGVSVPDPDGATTTASTETEVSV